MGVWAFAILTVLSTATGGVIGLRYRSRLHELISFTAGVLVAVAFFDIIPEVFALSDGSEALRTSALVAVVGGFLAIHILEKAVAMHSAHEGEYIAHRHPLVGTIGASALAIHSVLDGVGIGLGFQVSPHVGTLIALAVIAHDFTDGLNTVNVLLLNRNVVRRAVQFLVIDALAPLLGVIITTVFTIPQHLLAISLGCFAGFLLYLGASDLLPEAHSEHSSWRLIGLTILGATCIFVITRFT